MLALPVGPSAQLLLPSFYTDSLQVAAPESWSLRDSESLARPFVMKFVKRRESDQRKFLCFVSRSFLEQTAVSGFSEPTTHPCAFTSSFVLAPLGTQIVLGGLEAAGRASGRK